MTDRETAIEHLKKIIDPEIGLDLWTLELIYEINITDKTCEIVMTLTSPMCPFGPKLMQQVEEEMYNAGFDHVEVRLTFEPYWEPSDDVKMELGLL